MIVQMTLTGAYEGQTKTLNGLEYVDGIAMFEGSEEEVANLTKYHQRCYQVKAEINPGLDEECGEEDEDEISEPNNRQEKIIEAINAIEKSDWSYDGAVPHPKVMDVSTLMDDATVTLEEILYVIETWLSE